jgi:hypothetical protein
MSWGRDVGVGMVISVGVEVEVGVSVGAANELFHVTYLCSILDFESGSCVRNTLISIHRQDTCGTI